MRKREASRMPRREGKLHYRDTLKIVHSYFHSVEPDPEFSLRLEELCESLGAEELFQAEHLSRLDGTGRKGIIIGGAICSALPFVGVAAYALRKHMLRRRVVPMSV
ncbi:MAG: hypothetical protein SWK76_14535 [Actinomycetota bacterium]|nr:hypothetical protein [Actinomycetota bacterium]